MTLAALLEIKTISLLAVFVILFFFERIRPAAIGRRRHLKSIVKNLSFWFINGGFSFLIVLPVSIWASSINLWERSPWFFGGGSNLLMDMLLLDLFIYWWHRANHEVKFLWRFHEIHHLDEQLDTTSAVRFHFVEVLFSCAVRAVVIITFAIPFYSVVLFEVLVAMAAFFHHSNITLPSKLEKGLSKIIITPSLHWVHHHAIKKDTDSNYGTIFSFWDRVFLSKSATKRSKDLIIGVEGKQDTAFLKLIAKPFGL